ncbi:MAG: RNA polymerase sigma factor [Planctomycetota bacterium]
MRANKEYRENVERATEVFDEYGDTIRAMISFHANNREEEDLFQALFLSLVRKPIPRGIRNVRGYLYKVVINDVFDDARKSQAHRNRIDKYAKRRKLETAGGQKQTPTDIAVWKEEKLGILQMIAEELPPREGQAVIQRYCLGNSVTAGAKKMGIGKRTFSRYACLGLKKIRGLLSKENLIL